MSAENGKPVRTDGCWATAYIGVYLQEKRETMNASTHFDALNLLMLPDGQVCQLDDDFLLADNLGISMPLSDLSVDPYTNLFVKSPYPFRIQFVMLLACTGGFMRFRLHLKEYVLRENDLLIVHKGSIGECLEISPDCRLALVAFSDDYYAPEISAQGSSVIRRYVGQEALLPLSSREMGEFLSVYRAIFRKISDPAFLCKREIVMSYMQVLFCELWQSMSPRVAELEVRRESRRQQLFDRFLQLVARHCTAERKLEFYADKLCVTPKYLSRCVHATSGHSAGEWIRNYVVLEAKVLLKSGQYTVQQVSELLNFPNQSFFGTYFKQATGHSPKAYQRAE